MNWQKNVEEMLTMLDTTTKSSTFPFTLDDLDYWMIEREDGTVVKFTVDGRTDSGYGKGSTTVVLTSTPTQSLSAYCKHDPSPLAVFNAPKVGLWIADAMGTRSHKKEFDLVIDGGDVLTIWAPAKPRVILKGDPLAEELADFITPDPPTDDAGPRILQIDWYDRKAPNLDPAFWPALAEKLNEDDDIERVLCCCQGGHGRSGTSLVSLMMCYTDYSPLDAITHLRAIHCPRAIESTVQHDYLNLLAKYLGREPNSHESYKVTDFKARFLTLTSPHAEPYQNRLIEAK